MMTQVLFIQGGGEGTHDEWDNKLVESLGRELGAGYQIRYPRMPNEGEPSYARWKVALEDELAKLDDGAILVGHSIGATMLIHTLVEGGGGGGTHASSGLALRGVFLIAAPFVGKDGWSSEEMEIEPISNLGATRLPSHVYLYHGSDDETAPVKHINLYAQAIPHAVVRELAGRDHQLNDDMSEVATDIRQLA